jgi:hypothetical protein
MMEYNSVANPVWLDATHKMISVEVVFPHLGETPVKFHASPDDSVEHGRQIYEELIAGTYGLIAEPVQG